MADAGGGQTTPRTNGEVNDAKGDDVAEVEIEGHNDAGIGSGSIENRVAG